MLVFVSHACVAASHLNTTYPEEPTKPCPFERVVVFGVKLKENVPKDSASTKNPAKLYGITYGAFRSTEGVAFASTVNADFRVSGTAVNAEPFAQVDAVEVGSLVGSPLTFTTETDTKVAAAPLTTLVKPFKLATEDRSPLT